MAARVLTTRRWGLSRAEWATTALAAVLSSTGYVLGGLPYLSRGVLGDLAGFAVLAVVAAARRERLRHEALLCLALIGVVLALDPQWPLEVREAVWWPVFAAGLLAYLAARRAVTDRT